MSGLVSGVRTEYRKKIKDLYEETLMRSLFIAVALAVVVAATPALAQNPLFITNTDFAPYSMISEGHPSGIDVEVLTQAATRAGIAIDIEFKPWDQLLEMVKNGECAGAFSLFHTPERENFAMFMDAVPVHLSDYVLFTKVGTKFSFRTYDDLAGKIIGRVDGTDLGAEFAEALAAGKINIKEYPDLAASIRGLLMGEIDAYAGNIDVTYYRLKDMGMTSSIVYLPKKIVEGKPAYLVMSRASNFQGKERLMQGLERALDLMKKDGTYNKIARKYLLRF